MPMIVFSNFRDGAPEAIEKHAMEPWSTVISPLRAWGPLKQALETQSPRSYVGPVHMEASHPTYRAGTLCHDLTLSLIPMQNLTSVDMSWQADPFSEISLVHWRDPRKQWRI